MQCSAVPCKTLPRLILLGPCSQHPDLEAKKVVFYTTHDAHKRACGAVLIAAWSVLYQGRTADEAFAPLMEVYPPFVPFRDAAMGICTFNLTVQDCLRAIHKAYILKWLDFETFDLQQYSVTPLFLNVH